MDNYIKIIKDDPFVKMCDLVVTTGFEGTEDVAYCVGYFRGCGFWQVNSLITERFEHEFSEVYEMGMLDGLGDLLNE